MNLGVIINPTTLRQWIIVWSTVIKGGSRTGAPGAPLPLWKKGTCFFWKFSLNIRKYFDFSQHAVFTLCILFTTFLTKTYVWRGIKANLRSKNFTAPRPRFEIPGSAPGNLQVGKKGGGCLINMMNISLFFSLFSRNLNNCQKLHYR